MQREELIRSPSAAPSSRLAVGRSRMVMAASLLLLTVMALRLGWVQKGYPERLAALRCFQNSRRHEIPASRGRIFDCNGRALVENRTFQRLFVNPSLVPEDQRENLAIALVEHLGCDPTVAQEALADTECTRRYLIDETTPEDLERFNSLPPVGPLAELMREVGVVEFEKRAYVRGVPAGPVIGFTSSRDDGHVGLWGIEQKYDDVLSGRPGLYEDLRDQRGRSIPGSRRLLYPPRKGTDLMLTLDADVQALAEAALHAGMNRTGANAGAVVITEPATGEVRALVSLPAFDPSDYLAFIDDEQAMFSRSTCLCYEAGSVMKVFTIAAGLEEGVVQPDSVLHVTWGPLRFRGGVVPDHDYSRGPDQSLYDVVVYSSNRGAAIVATRLGDDLLTAWLRSFGFGSRTPLAMPGEPCGNLKEHMRPLPEIDLANAGYGQGITVTPLQLAQAAGVFANRGVMVPLRLVRARRDPACAREIAIPPAPRRVVLNPQTAETMQGFMAGVVEEGTGKSAKTVWPCSSKTGTAQKASPHGGYSNDHISTFIGYGPLPNPEWLIVVILDEPDSPYYAGPACGPIFKEIFTALMLREGELPLNEQQRPAGEEQNPLDEYIITANPFLPGGGTDAGSEPSFRRRDGR